MQYWTLNIISFIQFPKANEGKLLQPSEWYHVAVTYNTEDFMFKIGHSYGEPENMTRQLNGEICEVRIWNVIRSQEEIYKNMYDVDPQTTGLKAYWKFNEGKGDIAKDYTENGNDAKAYTKAI